MRITITEDIGQVKLGNSILPGIFASMEVYGKLKIDEKQVPGSSGKRKQPLGFDDAEIALKLRLQSDNNSDCYTKAQQIVGIFHTVDSQAKPYVYRIVSKLTDMWNIREVLFEDLRMVDDNKDDTLRVDITLTEYRPALVLAEAKAQQPTVNSTTTSTTSTSTSQSGLGDLHARETLLLSGTGDFRVAESASNDYSDGGLRVAKNTPTPAVDDDNPIIA
ncbi:MAG: hypothetical protein P4N59_10815 [Negativicutes bacterium]|nr:hypothetical protein [Negativicutes bacterium]